MTSFEEVQWNLNSQGNIDRNNRDNILEVRDLLNETGSGFCLAKFTQVTLHLGTGLVHSCHHPKTHKIPLEELENNPNALFNTTHLKKARHEMMSDKKPTECEYCWRVEDTGEISDRYLKSMEPWALENHDTIISTDPSDDFFPTYLEVDFSNVCNFKCIYCGPEYSSKWADELRRLGPLKVLENTKHEQWIQGYQEGLENLTYKNNECNPYIDAFWNWFPQAYTKLKTYRITGGEPLLSKETYRSIDWLIENPNIELEFNINTNLCAPEALWDKFVNKIEQLVKNKSVKKFTVYTSLDAWGKQAEYLRPGLDIELFKQRYIQLLDIGNIRVTTMCTFNLLSLTTFIDLLKWQLELKKRYNPDSAGTVWELETGFVIPDSGDSFVTRNAKNPDHMNVVGIDTPYLRYPEVLDAQYATPDLIQKYLIPAMNFMSGNMAGTIWGSFQGFEPYEIEKFKRVCLQIMHFQKTLQSDPNKTALIYAKFHDYINEIDTRNESDFLEVFPEYRDFYIMCKNKRENLIVRSS
jgi:organic radical activating enzyme